MRLSWILSTRLAPLLVPLVASLAVAPAAFANTSTDHASELITLDGEVIAQEARWSGGNDRIVTDSLVRTSDGQEVWVSQLGGTVDGIGMIQIPGQTLVAPGDRVSLAVAPRQATTLRTRGRAPMPVHDVLMVDRAGQSGQLGLTEPKATTQDEHGLGTGAPMRFVRTKNEVDVPLYWASGCVFITYDSDGTTHLADDLEFEVMDQVFATWRQGTQSCSYFTFELGQRERVKQVAFDSKNIITFREDKWCRPATGDDPERCYNRAAAALTTLFFVNTADSERSGEILDADIEFNAVNFAISANGITRGQPSCDSDLANTLTHEVGHLMGLDHTCRTSAEEPRLDDKGQDVPLCSLGSALPREVRDATMYATQDCGETIKSTPESDDLAGVCAIYPLEQDPGECAVPGTTTRRGCCSVAPGQRPAAGADPGAAALWPLVLLAAVLAVRRFRRGRSHA